MKVLVFSAFLVLATLASAAANAGPQCEKCGKEVQAALQACKNAGKDTVTCNKENQSKAQACQNICTQEMNSAGKGKK